METKVHSRTVAPERWRSAAAAAIGIATGRCRSTTLLIGLPVAAMVAALIINIVVPPKFQAHASVLVRFGREYVYRPVTGESSNVAPWRTEIAVNAELEILNSQTVKNAVIAKLGSERVLGPEAPSSGTKPWWKTAIKESFLKVGLLQRHQSEISKALQTYEKSFQVVGVKNSNVINMSYISENRKDALDILKAHLDEYMALREALYKSPGLESYEKVLRLRREALEKAQGDFEDFKEKRKITMLGAQLRNLFSQELQIRNQIMQIDTDIKQTEAFVQSSPLVGGVPLSVVAEAEAKKKGFVVSRQQLLRELATVQEAIKVLEGRRAEFELLEGNISFARRQLNSIQEKISEVRLEDAVAPSSQSGVRILQEPYAPELPSGPSPLLKILLAGALGFVAALGLIAGQRAWQVTGRTTTLTGN